MRVYSYVEVARLVREEDVHPINLLHYSLFESNCSTIAKMITFHPPKGCQGMYRAHNLGSDGQSEVPAFQYSVPCSVR
jgi:hypothetical protein